MTAVTIRPARPDEAELVAALVAELAAQLRQSVAGFRLPDGVVDVSDNDYPVLPAEEAGVASSRPRRVGGLVG